MADISKIKTPDGTTYDLKDTAGRKEANLEWGGKNFSASYGPIDAAMIPDLGANRFAFLKPAGIAVEYSNDGGSTWTDYGLSDTNKIAIFANGGSAYLGKHSANGSSLIGDQLRITISTGAAAIYSYLNKFAIYMSTQGNTVQVKIEVANESAPSDYTTLLDWTGVSGWSGWNILNTSGITTYGNSPSYQKGRVRFIFRQTAVTTTYSAAGIWRIMAFGGVGWTTPSNMAKTGHLYSYDSSQNATFPANVTATQFNGALNGNASTASLAVKARRLEGTDTRNTNQAPSWYITNYPYGITHEFKATSAIGVNSILTSFSYCDLITMVPYADGSGGYPIQIAQNYSSQKRAIRYATGSSAWGAWKDMSDAETVGGHSVLKDVPSDAKFTDTTYPDATTSVKGITKLNTATNSTSTTEAATPSAVKTAYDLANTANGTANTALSGVNGTLIYDHTYSITNGVATFVPHVYLKGEEVTSQYAASCFSWKYRLDSNVTGTPSYVNLTTDSTTKGCTVTISTLGYGGHVIGTFTPPSA